MQPPGRRSWRRRGPSSGRKGWRASRSAISDGGWACGRSRSTPTSTRSTPSTTQCSPRAAASCSAGWARPGSPTTRRRRCANVSTSWSRSPPRTRRATSCCSNARSQLSPRGSPWTYRGARVGQDAAGRPGSHRAPPSRSHHGRHRRVDGPAAGQRPDGRPVDPARRRSRRHAHAPPQAPKAASMTQTTTISSRGKCSGLLTKELPR